MITTDVKSDCTTLPPSCEATDEASTTTIAGCVTNSKRDALPTVSAFPTIVPRDDIPEDWTHDMDCLTPANDEILYPTDHTFKGVEEIRLRLDNAAKKGLTYNAIESKKLDYVAFFYISGLPLEFHKRLGAMDGVKLAVHYRSVMLTQLFT